VTNNVRDLKNAELKFPSLSSLVFLLQEF